MNDTPVTLSAGALAGLADREGAGTLHLSLQPEPMWFPQEELDSVRSALDREVADAGLLDGRGRLDPDFRDILPVLTGAAVEYYGWLLCDGVTWSALAAARGLLGVLAVRKDDRVTIRTIDHTELAEALVRQLPEVGPGGGSRWVVRTTDFQEAMRHTHQDRSIAATAAEIGKVMERPTTGGGELYLAERDPAGHRRGLRRPLYYVDTDWGRYVNYRVRVGDDEEFHVHPADLATVVADLQSMRSQLTVSQRA